MKLRQCVSEKGQGRDGLAKEDLSKRRQKITEREGFGKQRKVVINGLPTCRSSGIDKGSETGRQSQKSEKPTKRKKKKEQGGEWWRRITAERTVIVSA